MIIQNVSLSKTHILFDCDFAFEHLAYNKDLLQDL